MRIGKHDLFGVWKIRCGQRYVLVEWRTEMNRAQWHRSVFAATVRPRVLFFFSISNALLKTFTIDSTIVLPSLKFVRDARKLYAPSNFIRREICVCITQTIVIKLFFSVDQDKQSNIEKKIISRKSWFVRNYYKCYPLFSIVVFKRLLRRTIPLSV